jgi:predicted permease
MTVASLALGLALALCMAAVINAYARHALPYGSADRLYHVMYAPPGPWEPRGMSGLDWTSVRDVIDQPIAALSDGLNLTDSGYAMAARGLRVGPGFTAGLGLRVVAGRGFADQDFRQGAERVALIGHGLWRDRFGADPAVIGRAVVVDPDSHPGIRETLHIVGVLPAGFFFGRDSTATVDFLIPETSPVRAYMVRLRTGVAVEAAERRVTEAARAAATSPIPADWPGVRMESVYERYVGGLRPTLQALSLAVALVLAIVCANVAVLMLLRSLRRQKENAVRLALGATRWELARTTLLEAAILTTAALVVGASATTGMLTALSPVIEAQLGRPSLGGAGVVVDTRILAAGAGVSILMAIAVSLVPLSAWGRNVLSALRQDGRVSTDGASMRRIRQALVTAEVAGSLVLLVGCGLMIRSVSQMMRVDLGFNPIGLSRSRVMLKAGKYADGPAYSQFYEAFAARLATGTGSTITFSSWPPYVEAPSHRVESDGGAAEAGTIAVSPGYFALFSIAIPRGRAFSSDDRAASSAIVSETLARNLWPGGDGVGRRVRAIDQTGDGLAPGPWRTVVGIARDVRQAYDDRDRADLYTPKIPDGRYGTFYLRASASRALFDALRSTASAIDADAVISEPRTLAYDDQRLAGTRFMARLLAGFAGSAAFLAMLGVYGVTAYAVEQRRKEVAIRWRSAPLDG